jgi:hypothetical protein
MCVSLTLYVFLGLFLWLTFFFCLFCPILACCFFLDALFFFNEREIEGVWIRVSGSVGKDLGGVGEEETVIRIHSMYNYFQIRKKKK